MGLLLGALLLTGCGLDLDLDSDRSRDDPRSEARKDRTQRITAGRTGISFELPDEWLVIDPDKGAVLAASNEQVSAYFEDNGITPDTFEAIMRRVHVLVLGPAGSGITLAPAPGMRRVPGEAMVRSILSTVGADLDASEQVRTPLGPGRVGHYSVDMSGVAIHGSVLYFASGGGIESLTVSARTAAMAANLLDQVTPTLKLRR